MTITWLEVATLEEQELQGRPRRRAKWRPSDGYVGDVISKAYSHLTLRITVDQDFVKDMIVASWGWNHWVSCIVTYLFQARSDQISSCL